MKIFRKIVRDLVDEVSYQKRLRGKVNVRLESTLQTDLKTVYVISSNAGIFLLDNQGYLQVSELDVFGISICTDYVYVAVSHKEDSVILKGHREALMRGGGSFNWQELYRVSNSGHSGRIHQIYVHSDWLWITDTKRNLLTKIDRNTGEWKASIGPFICSYGHPILSDHNHLNGVFAQDDYLVFSAFRINKRSALCLCGKGKLYVFAHRNMGVHDCIFTGKDFWFSDSYRMFDEGKSGGIPFRNAVEVDLEYFDKNPSYFVRGIAGCENEVIIGNSFSGSREERFKGKGNIILLRNEKVVETAEFPGAQIYDILLLENGQHFDQPATVSSFEEAVTLLTQYLGDPVEELMLSDLMVSQRGVKTFAQSDVGDIEEYL